MSSDPEPGEYEYDEIYAPGMFDHLALPADVPVTLDFGERIGQAHVTRNAYGLDVTARISEPPAELAEHLAELPGQMPFAMYPDNPLNPPPVTASDLDDGVVVIHMTLGNDGKWHASP